MYPPIGLGAFNPGVAAAQAAGVKVTREPYYGDTVLSAKRAAQKMAEGRLDPRIRKKAIDVLRESGIDGRDGPSVKDQAQAMLDHVRATTIYVPDPVHAEHITGPATLLCLSPTECVQGEDCESLVALLGALCMTIGINCRAVKQTFSGGAQEHLILHVQDERGNWLAADPSDKRMPVGSSHPAEQEMYVDPLNPEGTKTIGADLVTLGQAPSFLGSFLGATPIERRMQRLHQRRPDFVNQHCDVCRHYAWHMPEQQPIGGHHPACSKVRGLGAASASVVAGWNQPIVMQPYATAGISASGNDFSGVTVDDPSIATASVSGTSGQVQATGAGGFTVAHFAFTNAYGKTATADVPVVVQVVPVGVSPGQQSGPFAVATTDLASMAVTKGAGDAKFASGDYAGALQAYQAAGTQGVNTVGPDIDASGASSVTSPMTGAASVMNKGLQALSAHDQPTAQTAQDITQNMLTVYQNAINAGAASLPSQPAAPPSTSSSGAGWALGLLAISAAVGSAIALVKFHKEARENPLPPPSQLMERIWRSKGGQFSYPGGALGRKMHRAGKCPHCRRGARECTCGAREAPRRHSGVQSLMFSRSYGWNASTARSWALRHGYRPTKSADVTDDYVHLRIASPGRFRRIRTIPFSRREGISARVGFN